MDVIIKKYEKMYKNAIKDMMKKFYKTDGVLHDISEDHIDATLTMLDKESELIDVWIVLVDDVVAGYNLISNTYSSECGGLAVWIEEIYIKDEYKGKKLSKKLLEFVIENYKTAKRIRLEAVENNYVAIDLFKKYGFEKLNYVQFIR